jgi:[ribosomal protein S18]-alanine N-acetyltransferase
MTDVISTVGDAAVAIRPATRDDLPAILAIERASFSDPWSRGSFASLLERPRVFFAVAVEGPHRAVVGHVVTWFVVDEAELANLAVVPGSRRRGIGAALLGAALDAAEARGARVMYLEVRASNRAALALYGSRGFEEAGRRRDYYRRPVEDALILRRACNPPDATGG